MRGPQLAIYDEKYPRDVYDFDSPLSDYVDGIGLVCAQGQDCVLEAGLKLRTTQHYFRGITVRNELLAYPGRQLANLRKGIAEEPAVWMVGTAFAIDRYRMLSAWHVVDDVLGEVDAKDDATKLRVVTGYYRKSSNRSKPVFGVHRVRSVQHVQHNGAAIDVALIELQDPVSGDDVAEVHTRVNWVKDDDPVAIIGHQLGQPLKIAEGRISDADPSGDRSDAHARFSASVLW